MKKICFIVAMAKEAQPLIEAYNMHKTEGYLAPLPAVVYTAIHGDTIVHVVTNGSQGDGKEKRDLIGCEAAAITTQAAITHLDPDIVISTGTCGGMKRHNTVPLRVYLSSGVMFHDRIVPGDNAFSTQGVGNYPVWEGTELLYRQLLNDGYDVGYDKITTGSSFFLSKEQEEVMEANGGRLIDMEGAAVAFVTQIYNVPFMGVKVVSNLCDVDNGDITPFYETLKKASDILVNVNKRIIEKVGAVNL